MNKYLEPGVGRPCKLRLCWARRRLDFLQSLRVFGVKQKILLIFDLAVLESVVRFGPSVSDSGGFGN